MRYVSLLLILFPLAALAQQCTIGQGSTRACANHILVLIDSSSYMKTASRARMAAQFVNTYLSQFDFSNQVTKVSMGFFGMSDPSVSYSPVYLWFGQNDPSMMCSDYNDFINQQYSNNMGQCSITSAILSLYNVTENSDWNFDEIVLVTASTDQNDVQQASRYLNLFTGSQVFTVISLGGADFSSWSGTRVLCPPFPFPSFYETTVYKQACRVAPGNNQCRGTQTTTSTTTTTTTTTTITTTTAAPLNQCPCNPAKIWNDIFVLYDGSNVLPSGKFRQLTNLIEAMALQLPIGQANGFYSRVGVSVYSNDVKTYANLTKYQSATDMLMDSVVALNQEGTNIKAAIDNARDYFDNQNQHRPNARKVIVLGASTYREGNYDSPVTSATTFKDNGGVIMVIAYGDLHGETSDVLQKIASPGYYIDATSQAGNVNQLLNLQCAANCFCPPTYLPLATSATGEPRDGCYLLSDLQSLQVLAKRFCTSQTNGTLAMTKDSAQKLFSTSKVTVNVPVWIGLEQVNSQWQWADGTPFYGSIQAGSGSCATIKRTNGFNTAYTQAQCLGSAYDYACQAVPCSSGNFCPVQQQIHKNV